MGKLGTRLGVLGAAVLIVVLGCKHDDNLKPPKQEPEYRLPPDDARYSSPPRPPESTLNQFPQRNPAAEDPSAKRPGGGFGMGGPGAGR